MGMNHQTLPPPGPPTTPSTAQKPEEAKRGTHSLGWGAEKGDLVGRGESRSGDPQP